MDITEILGRVDHMTIAQLEAEHQDRDAQIQRLQTEKRRIHEMLEPKRYLEMQRARATADPSKLQVLDIPSAQLGQPKE